MMRRECEQITLMTQRTTALGDLKLNERHGDPAEGIRGRVNDTRKSGRQSLIPAGCCVAELTTFECGVDIAALQ